jgi:hypothetical protein
VKLEGPAKDFQVSTCILSSSERKEESANKHLKRSVCSVYSQLAISCLFIFVLNPWAESGDAATSDHATDAQFLSAAKD